MLKIDTREPYEEIIDKLIDVGYSDYDIEKLEHKTDFLFHGEQEFGIQRKTVNDFVSSLDTLKDDLHELRQHNDLTGLLLEGEWQTAGQSIALRRGASLVETVPISSWHNFMLSQQLRGTVLIRTTSLSETCKTLAAVDAWLDSDMSAPTTQADDPETMLTMIPSIGPGRANKLMREYDSTYDALVHVGDWDGVNGIGEKTKGDALDYLLGVDDA